MHDDPGHALWKRDFTGASSLFSIVFKPMPDAAAHAFINFLLDPTIGAQEIQYTYYAQAETEALATIPDAIKSDPIIYPPASALSPLETRKATPAGQKARDQIFAEFKAA